MATPSESCWTCGATPTQKNRRILNSPANRKVLDLYHKIGVVESSLPPLLKQTDQGELISCRIYVCRTYFADAEKVQKLLDSPKSAVQSMRSKLGLVGELNVVLEEQELQTLNVSEQDDQTECSSTHVIDYISVMQGGKGGCCPSPPPHTHTLERGGLSPLTRIGLGRSYRYLPIMA